jgi:hypothetical protein
MPRKSRGVPSGPSRAQSALLVREDGAPRRRALARGAAFAGALFDFLYGREGLPMRFQRWCDAVAALPRRKTRVLTWPIVAVFGFIAHPDLHVFLKPNVMRTAARLYGLDFRYTSRPSWPTYASLLDIAATVRRDLRDLRPRDMIDAIVHLGPRLGRVRSVATSGYRQDPRSTGASKRTG